MTACHATAMLTSVCNHVVVVQYCSACLPQVRLQPLFFYRAFIVHETGWRQTNRVPSGLSEPRGLIQHAVALQNFLSLVPLALLLGEVTEDLAVRFGDTIGGLLNATFGNVVELILSIAALQKGLYDVVATSLVGSVLSNLLLVLGACLNGTGCGLDRPAESGNERAMGLSQFAHALCGAVCCNNSRHGTLRAVAYGRRGRAR